VKRVGGKVEAKVRAERGEQTIWRDATRDDVCIEI
jgi:hypothetical protein